MGRHRKFSEEKTAELDRSLDALLTVGGVPKAWAMEHGLCISYAYRHAQAMGWSSFYVTKEERARILARRRYQAADPFKTGIRAAIAA